MVGKAHLIKISANCFLVRTFMMEIEVSKLKQAIRVNTVCAKNAPQTRASSLEDHADDCGVVLKNVYPGWT